jgi:hypothetical protein
MIIAGLVMSFIGRKVTLTTGLIGVIENPFVRRIII